jgi:hypothetical protein
MAMLKQTLKLLALGAMLGALVVLCAAWKWKSGHAAALWSETYVVAPVQADTDAVDSVPTQAVAQGHVRAMGWTWQ